ncbi:hypothetical protein HAX54_012774, partial [Datura stramonium]|nr:hypothetical protein [Datura stramonium]
MSKNLRTDRRSVRIQRLGVSFFWRAEAEEDRGEGATEMEIMEFFGLLVEVLLLPSPVVERKRERRSADGRKKWRKGEEDGERVEATGSVVFSGHGGRKNGEM